MLNAMNALSSSESLLTLPLWKNMILVYAITLSMALHFGLLYTPILQNVFGIVPLGWGEWKIVLYWSAPIILIDEVLHDTSHDLGVDPGLQKDGVEKHLQELLAEHPATLADGLTLVRREFMTAIGPVDLMCRDADGLSVAVEIKRRGEIDGVEQLTRYLELLNRDPALTRKGAVRGIFAAQEIKPQARVLATDRGIACALVNYDALRGMDDGAEHRLF